MRCFLSVNTAAAMTSHDRTRYLRRPLHLAAANGHLNVLHALLAAGADIEAADQFVLFCIWYGSASHATRRWQRTPVVLAAANGHAHVVQSLIQERAAVDVKDK